MKRCTKMIATSREEHEQAMLVQWMNLKRIKFFSVPNEAALRAARNRFGMMNKMKATGLTPGAPDLVLITPPPKLPGFHVAIEMKRGGPRPGVVSDNQREIHWHMEESKWKVLIGDFDSVRKQMEGLGW